MDDTDLFSTEIITVPICFRLIAIALLSLSFLGVSLLQRWDMGGGGEIQSEIIFQMILMNLKFCVSLEDVGTTNLHSLNYVLIIL